MSTAVAEQPAAPVAATPSAPAATPPASAGAPAASPATTGATAPAGAPAATPSLLSEAPKPADPAKPDAAVKTDAPAAWELKAPEGAPLSADEVKAAEKFAKDNGLTQAQAEKILARDIDGRKAMTEARQAESAKTGDAWLAETKADPVIGGDKLAATVANAQKALNAIYTPEEAKAIKESPFANNRIFLKALSAIGARLQEDTIHSSTPASSAADTHPARILYPSLAPKA